MNLRHNCIIRYMYAYFYLGKNAYSFSHTCSEDVESCVAAIRSHVFFVRGFGCALFVCGFTLPQEKYTAKKRKNATQLSTLNLGGKDYAKHEREIRGAADGTFALRQRSGLL